MVQVRGKAIPFDKKIINACFQMPEYDEDYLADGVQSYNLDDVIKRLCKPGTTWKMNEYIQEYCE